MRFEQSLVWNTTNFTILCVVCTALSLLFQSKYFLIGKYSSFLDLIEIPKYFEKSPAQILWKEMCLYLWNNLCTVFGSNWSELQEVDEMLQRSDRRQIDENVRWKNSWTSSYSLVGTNNRPQWRKFIIILCLRICLWFKVYYFMNHSFSSLHRVFETTQPVSAVL